jgi:methyl-accepting chemotaxis protein
MKQVQTRLAVLGIAALAALSFLVSMVMRSAYAEYVGLANFQETTVVSLAAYDLARNLTIERQLAYQASAFLGEGTRLQMTDRYRASVETSHKSMDQLRKLANEQRDRFTPRFRKSLDEAIASEGPLGLMRDEIFDPHRSQSQEAGNALKSKALKAYDVAIASQANFLFVLALETHDAELVRKIITQDNLARLQKDLWKIKGLVSSVLRDDRLMDNAAGELKDRRLSIDDHAARLFNLSDPLVAGAVQQLLESEDYVLINALANKILLLGSSGTGFNALVDYAAYQTGPFMRVEPQFEKLGVTVTASITGYTQDRLSAARQRLSLLVGFSLAALVGLGIFIVFISRSITRPLRYLSAQLAETAGHGAESSRLIANSSQRLSDDASQESAALQQITASVEQLSGMTTTNLEHVRNMSHLASKAAGVTDEGKQNVATLTEAMAGIQKTSNDIAAILRTIDEIAFQTNILALNAAVEAARAGEAGAGFAVVAEEVRRLAQRSAQAAQETRLKIELALRSNAHGAQIGQLVEQRFVEISAITRDYQSKVAEIETASLQSTQGINQVKAAIDCLDRITQRTAASAEENASASAEMNAEVDKIFRYIEMLESMVARRREMRARPKKRSVAIAGTNRPVNGGGRSVPRERPVAIAHSWS